MVPEANPPSRRKSHPLRLGKHAFVFLVVWVRVVRGREISSELAASLSWQVAQHLDMRKDALFTQVKDYFFKPNTSVKKEGKLKDSFKH